MAQSGYQLGFTSLDREVADVSLPIEGELPQWLSGSLIRTGPAKFEIGGKSLAHWFDGFAMLHGFRIEAGAVTYSNQFLHSQSFSEAHGRGRLMRSEFMSDPCRTLFGRVMALFDPKLTDNGSVNVASISGRMLALTETPMPVEIDPITLASLGHSDSATPETAGQITSAHPHQDRGRTYSYSIAFGKRSSYRLFVEEEGRRRLLAELPVREPAYMHSFGMSERHLVLTEFPLRVNPLRLALSSEPFIRRYRWRPELGTRITVIDKQDGSIAATARAPACFAFHHVNAYEDGNGLCVDILGYDDAGIIEALRLARLRSGESLQPAARLMRFRVPLGLTRARVEREVMSDCRLELPRIDYERRVGRKYGAVWGVGQSEPGNFLDSIVKLTLLDKRAEVTAWKAADCFPGEPVFVARPGGISEDDGILLSVVLDAARSHSFLLVLDAASLVERARAAVPHHIPFGFHGNHFPVAR